MKKIRRRRTRACERQAGRCFYCHCLMWQGNDVDTFRIKHNLTSEQALQLRCTAEHVIARCDGGSDSVRNVVAACLYCNQKRHACLQAMASSDYAVHVRSEIQLKRWHLFDPDSHDLRPDT